MRNPAVPRDSITFLREHPDFRQAVAAALQDAGPAGVDSVDLLLAAAGTLRGGCILARLGVDAARIQEHAPKTRLQRVGKPGMTEDAKKVIEAISLRAICQRRGPDIRDLLVGLANTDCVARDVLKQNGIDEERLIALTDA